MAKQGVDASERALNLAMYLASRSEAASLSDIFIHVEGYAGDSSDAATLRMFETDKDFLRSYGFSIVTSGDDGSCYTLDDGGSFADPLDLAPHEAATLRVVGSLVLTDPSFPLADDLRLALVKLAESLGGSDQLAAGSAFAGSSHSSSSPRTVTPAQPTSSSKTVVLSAQAIETRKTLTYRYPTDESVPRTVEPYGLFSYGPTWYLVAFDQGNQEIRTFNCDRINDLALNTTNPKTPDYEIPEDFNVASYRGLPFSYGSESPLMVTTTFGPESSWQVARLTQNVGTIAWHQDGSATWTVEVRNRNRFLQWLISNAPDLALRSQEPLPDELQQELICGLESVVSCHE